MIDRRVYHQSENFANAWRYIDGSDLTRYNLTWSEGYIKYGENIAEPRFSIPFSQPHILVRVIPSKLPYCINAMVVEGDYINDQNYIVIFNTILPMRYILAILNSRLLSYWFANKLGKMQRGLFPQMKAGELKLFPVVKCSKDQQRPFIEKAEIMLAKNKELHELSSKFLALLKSEFALEKPSTKLEQWYTLDFAAFMAELAKKKITPSLAQKAEWMAYFEQQKAAALTLKTLIDTTDHEIDQMVYALYNLTPEEIAIVEGKA